MYYQFLQEANFRPTISSRTDRKYAATNFHYFDKLNPFPFTRNIIERFSSECSKTKTKVITLTNHNRRKQNEEPIRTWRQARENACDQVMVGLIWHLIGLESVVRFSNQSEDVVKQNQTHITFDTQLKTALLCLAKNYIIFILNNY